MARLRAERITPCALTDKGDYLVRHVPAAYFSTSVRTAPAGRCPSAARAMEPCTPTSRPAGCPDDRVAAGDRWLRIWLPLVLAGPDYRCGRLVVVITWDEGTSRDDHIPPWSSRRRPDG